MGILSKLAGKAIKGGIEGGLKGPKTKALLTRADLPPEAPAAPVARETTDIQPTPTPAEITPPTTDMAPITPVPPVAADKTARMMMLQGKPIEAAPPITPVETPPIRAEIDVVPPVREEMDEFVSPSVFDATRSRKEAQKIGGYWTDNPKGEWLKEQREYAAEKMKQNPVTGIARGSQTASIGGAFGKAEMRTSFLKDLPGARGEEAFRTSSHKAKLIRETVEDEGWKPDPIMVWVNYDGKVYIAEGNHRVALAVERGEEFLPVDIRYFAGSEEVEGLFNPKTLEKNKALRLTEAEDPIKEEMDKLVPSADQIALEKLFKLSRSEKQAFTAGGRGGGKGGGGDGIDEDTAPLEEIRAKYKVSQRQKVDPELAEGAKQIAEGKPGLKEEAIFGLNKNETWDELVQRKYPPTIITEVPKPASLRRIEAVLGKKAEKGILGNTVELLKLVGEKVSVRLDINAYQDYNTWISTIHKFKSRGTPGNVLAYAPAISIKNVLFHTPDLEKPVKKALAIAQGGQKNPYAGMEGIVVNRSVDDIYNLAQKQIADPKSEWIQIGMNPRGHSYFIDNATGQPVLSAEEVIQVGKLVLARNVERGKASDFTFEEGGVVDMRDGGRVRMKSGGKAAAYDLSELEKAVDIDREGITEASRFVQDYGKHRVGRMSQTDTGYPPLPQRKEVIGQFYEGTKDIYTKPYEIDELGRPVPFDKKAAIQIEQHEAGGHSFLDAARAISMNEKVLKTLPVKEQKRLFKFLDFWEKQVTPEGKELVYFTREHDIMGTGPYASIKKKFLYPSDPREADIAEPKSIWTEDEPLAVLPDDPVGKGIGRSSTINKIAKSLNKAYAKYPEVYNEFFKKWRKEGINLPTYAGTYSKKLEELTSKENQAKFLKEVEQLQGISKNKGGKVGMQDGGVLTKPTIRKGSFRTNDAVYMLLKDAVLKNIFGFPVSKIQTEKNLNPRTIEVLRNLARKARIAGRDTITHADYGRDAQGAPISGIIGGEGEKEASKIYPNTYEGYFKLAKGVLTDPKLETVMTFGGASLHEDAEGNTILTDDYNAEKFRYGSASTGAYGKIRDFIGKWVTLEEEKGTAKKGTIKWNVNLGKLN